ncbi:Zn(2)-C6 fungal-type domain-containing protein [Mycena kentingensis (nom. inval.)]|nr:Zn(2)-C6 fungal-type domain-containing protein [Mycena kentingensis (nom. inval.)]
MSDNPSKKRSRNSGACDLCKRRKIRCDSGQTGSRCTNCLSAGVECTHAEVMKTLGSAKGYVESLETRLEKMERLLKQLLPGIDVSEQLEENSMDNMASDTLPRNDEDTLLVAIKKLTLDPEQHRFWGKSSGIQLVQTALNFKSHYAGSTTDHPPPSSLPKRRNEYWEPVKWLLPDPADEDKPEYDFPPEDLTPVLIDLYFKNVNIYWPVLHRPSFERRFHEQLHLRDHRYAATLLMVCSLASRHCDDPRVLFDGVDSNNMKHAAGWKYHNQVRVIPKHLVYKPNLFELQTIALSSIFLIAISPVAWNQIGFGLRRAQDVGAHRRMKNGRPSAEHEGWKRVFWVLVCLDWIAGNATGRPLAMHDGDYDQDFPLECDDAYWDLPEPLNFIQPKGLPSDISFFVSWIKLLEIQASVTTTIYACPTTKRHQWPNPVSSTLRRPDYHCFRFGLKLMADGRSNALTLGSWNVKILFIFNQSAVLHAAFYHVQAALPSLTICTNAARSCARIFAALEKTGLEPNQSLLGPAFTSAIVFAIEHLERKTNRATWNIAINLRDAFNDLIVRLISVGDMSNEPFTKNYIEFTAPPSAQPGYEPSVFVSKEEATGSALASKWPLEVTASYMADLQQRCENSDAEEPPTKPSAPWPHDAFANPEFLAAYNASTVPGLEQFMQQPPADMMVDSDILSMWSSAPSGFQLSDWASFMGGGAAAYSGSLMNYPVEGAATDSSPSGSSASAFTPPDSTQSYPHIHG